jgi:hypothetical protein
VRREVRREVRNKVTRRVKSLTRSLKNQIRNQTRRVPRARSLRVPKNLNHPRSQKSLINQKTNLMKAK